MQGAAAAAAAAVCSAAAAAADGQWPGFALPNGVAVFARLAIGWLIMVGLTFPALLLLPPPLPRPCLQPSRRDTRRVLCRARASRLAKQASTALQRLLRALLRPAAASTRFGWWLACSLLPVLCSQFCTIACPCFECIVMRSPCAICLASRSSNVTAIRYCLR